MPFSSCLRPSSSEPAPASASSSAPEQPSPKKNKMFIDRFFVSSRMSSIVFPRLQRERRRRADAEQEAEKWRQRAEQLEVADEDRARTVLDDARTDFQRAEEERKAAATDREAATLERQKAEETLKQAEHLMRRARRAGRWAVERSVQVMAVKEGLDRRERAIREEEEGHEMRRLGIFPITPITLAEIQIARSELAIVPDAVNICVTGAARSGKSSLINALRGLEADDPLAAPVFAPRSPEGAQPRKFHDAKAPGLVYHEVPEGRTIDITGWEYYVSKRMYAYDVLVLVHNDTPTELETRIAQIAHRRNQPCLHVRTKADEHIRNTRRTSKLVSVADARVAFMARVREEAARRREESSALEALRPTRDREFVVSEMGLHRLITGAEQDPDDVYGTGEDDEARFIDVLRGLIRPNTSEEKEVVEEHAPVEAPAEDISEMMEGILLGFEDDAPEFDDEPAEAPADVPLPEDSKLDDLKPETADAVEALLDGAVSEKSDDVEADSKAESKEEPKEAETPYQTPMETFTRLIVADDAAPAANGAANGTATTENGNAAATSNGHATAKKADDSGEDVKEDEVFGSCGERI